jgi:hypothetical protein
MKFYLFIYLLFIIYISTARPRYNIMILTSDFGSDSQSRDNDKKWLPIELHFKYEQNELVKTTLRRL